jgi:hypothetical protein
MASDPGHSAALASIHRFVGRVRPVSEVK